MKITDIVVTLLANPDLDPYACDSAQDAVIVEIETDEGITGIGEVDATPRVVEAFLTAPSGHVFALGMRELLLGEDPLDTRRLWHKLYAGTIMSARRGMGIHVIGALDVALWDLRGKYHGLPVWKLLGGAMRTHIVPYASILPAGASPEAVLDDAAAKMAVVRAEGFTAAKIEAVPQVTNGDGDVVDLARRCREALGPQITLMVDVGYRWSDSKSALATLDQMADLDIYMIETPVGVDNFGASADLARRTRIRVACGELNAGRQEFVELMDLGGVDIVQPDIPRAGGFTESMRIAEAAEDRGRLVIPHAWNTGITTATAIHFSAATVNCHYVEYLPPGMFDTGLRRDLLAVEPACVDGRIALPSAPGLGVELDPDAVAHYRVGSIG